jgi:hypothetical protein
MKPTSHQLYMIELEKRLKKVRRDLAYAASVTRRA